MELREIYLFYSNLRVTTYSTDNNSNNNSNNSNDSTDERKIPDQKQQNNRTSMGLSASQFELSQRMVMQQLWAFVNDCRLLSPHFTLADVNRIALHHSIHRTDEHRTKVTIMHTYTQSHIHTPVIYIYICTHTHNQSMFTTSQLCMSVYVFTCVCMCFYI